MNKDTIPEDRFSGLRKQAEKKLATKPEDTGDISLLSQESKDRLLQELQIHQVELEMQNEELRKTQLELEAARDRFSDLYDFAPVGYFTLSSKGIILSANLTGAAMLGVERSLLIKNRFTVFINKNDQDIFYKNIKAIEKTNAKQICELRLIKKDGCEFHAQLESIGIKEKKGDLNQVRIVVSDISERKRAEEQIKASLREKEVLLKEIHHRVKNNLQIVVSLLNLQSKYIEDKQTLEIFKETRERVRTMALLHEKVYECKDLSRINFREYVSSVVGGLISTYSLKPGQVQLKIEIEEIVLDIKTSIPLGLLINELVSNSLKYAFPGSRKGYLQVHLESCKGKSEEEKNNYALIVSDNGVGFPEDQDFRNTKTLGMRIVGALVAQLHGDIELDRKDGTSFTIKFEI